MTDLGMRLHSCGTHCCVDSVCRMKNKANWGTQCRYLLFGDYGVGERSEALNGDGDGFAGLEPAVGVAAEADAGRRAGGYDVAGQERGDGGEIFDERGDFENELTGVGVLEDFAVDGEADIEDVGIGDFVGGDDGGAEGAEGGEALAHGPLGAGELHVAGADIVDDGVAVDVIAPCGCGYAIAALSDHEGEFSFVVGLGGVPWEHDGLARADDRGGELEEDDGS